jgi:parallel beta-helix repeat protein
MYTVINKRYALYRKISAVLITLALVLSLCFTASIHVMATTTWYVDDSNTSGIEDGTAAHPYNTISEAVAAVGVVNGDTIIVAGGTYAETIAVDKSLIIRAKSGETATVNPGAGNNGFMITANGVTIDGFTITGVFIGIGIDNTFACTVTGNTISSSSGASIRLSYANNCIVEGNSCTDAQLHSIAVSDSIGNVILNNTCEYNYFSISLTNATGNTVCGNSCSYCYWGILLADSIENLIAANICSHNNEDSDSSGIYLTCSSANTDYSRHTFVNNTLEDNSVGINIGDSDIDASLIYFKNNNLIENVCGADNHSGTNTLDAGDNYWSDNTSDVNGDVNIGVRLDFPVNSSMAVIESGVITTAITQTTTATASYTQTETVLLEITSVTTVAEGTITMLKPTTLTETKTVTSTDTQTSTSTQSVTSTDTQSLAYTVIVPQTVSQTTTTTLTLTEETLDWRLIIIIAICGLLAGGLIVAIFVRKA